MTATLSTQITGAQKSIKELETLLTCSIALEELEDPVINKCGHTFERNRIELWLQSKNTCPVCRAHTIRGDLIPNRVVKQAREILKKRGRAEDGSIVVANEQERAIVSRAVEQLRPQTFARKAGDCVEKTSNYLSSWC